MDIGREELVRAIGMTATDPYIGIAACRVLRHRGLVPQRDLVLRMIELFVQQDAGRDLKDYRNKDIRADILFLAECAAAAGAADEARRLLENATWEIDRKRTSLNSRQ